MRLLKEMEDVINDMIQPQYSESDFETVDVGGGMYQVTLDGEDVCLVTFERDDGGTDDLATAQEYPNGYIVYIYDVKSRYAVEEFINKLKASGFENISLGTEGE